MQDSNCPKNGHYVRLSKLAKAEEFMERWQSDAVRIPVPSGALLLWDSRVTHQGYTNGSRLALPVCWQPRKYRSAAARAEKMKCCALGIATTHSALRCFRHSSQGNSLRLPLPYKVTLDGQDCMLLPSIIPAGSQDFTSAFEEGYADYEPFVSQQIRQYL